MQAEFYNYANSFIGEDQFVNENILLKINHTKNVVSLAEVIAKSINCTDDELYITKISALFHDIGRFPQFAKYKTFNDSLSENHALLGIDVLESMNFFESFSDNHKTIILNAVRSHNMKDVPNDFCETSKKVASIIRDADKLDIMRVLCEYYERRDSHKNEGLEVNLPDTEGYSEKIIELVYNKKTISNNLRKNLNDMKLVHLSWIFDLNFKCSLKIYKENNYHGIIFRHLPDDSTMHKLRSFIEKSLLFHIGKLYHR